VRQPDLLIMYGGSEVITPNRFHPNEHFQDYPEGFAVFPVGKADTSSLVILQKVAALGAEARDKKIIVSVTAACFYQRDMQDPKNYAGNFSYLHANELVFSTDLSLELKQRAAVRM